MFYKLFKKATAEIDDTAFVITIGVGSVKNDLEQLNHGAHEAESALAEMLSGGRGCVYYYEQNHPRNDRYYFPKDAEKRMIQDFKTRNQETLDALLDELYARNIKEKALCPSEIRAMLDELHYTMLNALREAFDLSTITLQIQRIKEPVTV